MVMEFEFTEGGDNDGQFMATGQVVEHLRNHLGRGEVDKAVSLYESCVQSVGDELWNEFKIASKSLKKSMANLFFRSRDYKRAAAACEELGEWNAAGRSYAACYNWERAADCYAKAGDRIKAAKMFEKAGDHRKAAEIFYEGGKYLESAESLEKAGDIIGAGQLFAKAGDDQRAAHLLSQATPKDGRYVMAVGLLSEVLVRLGRRDLAMQRLASAIKLGTQIKDKMTGEIAYRLGRLHWEEGQADQALQFFEHVGAWRMDYKDVATCIQSLKSGARKATQVTNPFMPVAATATGPVQVVKGQTERTPPARSPSQVGPPPKRGIAKPQNTDPFAALDGNPFGPKSMPRDTKGIQPPAPAETVRIGYVQRMDGYDVLKALPIFEDLNLDEMKLFYTICEQVFFEDGDILIEQGHPGEGLFIVREGSIRVTRVEPGGKETALATLPAGKYVGEMSLVDDAPTSARVTAAGKVKAFKIGKDRFEQFLFANDRIALRIYRTFVKTLSDRLRTQNARA